MARRAGPGAGADAVVLVDPVDPGAAAPDGVAAAAGAETGTPARVLAAADRPALLREVVARLTAATPTGTAGDAAEAAPAGRFVAVDAALVVAPTLLGDLLAGPRGVDDAAMVLRDGRGRVVAVRVPAAARPAVAAGLTAAADAAPLVALVDAVVAAGLTVSTLDPAPFRVDRPATADEAVAVGAWHAGEDERRLRLRRASRSDDGLLSTFLVRPPSRALTRVALALRLPAAAVTVLALLLGLAAAGAYAGGGTGWRVAGSLLLLCSLVVDCVDGQVARLTRTTSALGAWLDVAADRVKEYAVYAGLALGAHDRTSWLLALAAMGLLVTRHHVDLAYAAARAGTATDADSSVAAWSARTDARPATTYAKRFVIMPVGERTLVLVVLAPLVGVRWALGVLLAWGVLAAAWTTAGRVGRTVLARAWPGVRPGTAALDRLVAQAGTGLPVPRPGGRAGWLLVPLTRAVEQLGLTAVCWAVAPELLGPLFGWLAVVAAGQYDLVYRQRLLGDVRTSSPLRRFSLWLRLLVVLLVLVVAHAARAGHAASPGWPAAVLGAGAAVLAVVAVASSLVRWGASVRSAP